MSEIVNKVQQSPLETLDLEELIGEETIVELDFRPFLHRELILREKEFRKQMEEHNWQQYEGKWLGVTCSVDALIPAWAWMLVASLATPYAKGVLHGDESSVREHLLLKALDEVDWLEYENRFVLLKGCSKSAVPPSVYMKATRSLMPVAGKVMYGEACSNVPVYRARRK